MLANGLREECGQMHERWAVNGLRAQGSRLLCSPSQGPASLFGSEEAPKKMAGLQPQFLPGNFCPILRLPHTPASAPSRKKMEEGFSGLENLPVSRWLRGNFCNASFPSKCERPVPFLLLTSPPPGHPSQSTPTDLSIPSLSFSLAQAETAHRVGCIYLSLHLYSSRR